MHELPPSIQPNNEGAEIEAPKKKGLWGSLKSRFEKLKTRVTSDIEKTGEEFTHGGEYLTGEDFSQDIDVLVESVDQLVSDTQKKIKNSEYMDIVREVFALRVGQLEHVIQTTSTFFKEKRRKVLDFLEATIDIDFENPEYPDTKATLDDIREISQVIDQETKKLSSSQSVGNGSLGAADSLQPVFGIEKSSIELQRDDTKSSYAFETKAPEVDPWVMNIYKHEFQNKLERDIRHYESYIRTEGRLSQRDHDVNQYIHEVVKELYAWDAIAFSEIQILIEQYSWARKKVEKLKKEISITGEVLEDQAQEFKIAELNIAKFAGMLHKKLDELKTRHDRMTHVYDQELERLTRINEQIVSDEKRNVPYYPSQAA